ncbi:MAG: tRNA epoxyqueuosine(34) reductase QueG [Kiritimatiellae bacterium]|nr:tRNA epoxyqueuosine(34) reductase QueG [Kiritimatiellia bacterium]
MQHRPSARELISAALEHFDAAGIALPAEPLRPQVWAKWVAAGHYADMEWLARTASIRCRPSAAAPEVGAWLMVALALRVEPPAPAVWEDPRRGRIARYAWGPDYHAQMRARLQPLAERIRRAAGLVATPRLFVDTSPVAEKELAAVAGLGFIGRNTLLIAEGDGSWLSLGGLALPWRPTGAEPLPEPTLAQRTARGCGTCRRCRAACPTGALVDDHTLDARRCIAWATVECRGEIPLHLRPLTCRWLAGCDLCQECCPWCRPSPRTAAPRVAFDPELHAPLLSAALSLSPEEFRHRYGASAIGRIGWRQWIRNALVAAASAPADGEIRAAVARHVDCSDPIIRPHAAWALRRLTAGDAAAEL